MGTNQINDLFSMFVVPDISFLFLTFLFLFFFSLNFLSIEGPKKNNNNNSGGRVFDMPGLRPVHWLSQRLVFILLFVSRLVLTSILTQLDLFLLLLRFQQCYRKGLPIFHFVIETVKQ